MIRHALATAICVIAGGGMVLAGMWVGWKAGRK